MVSPYGRINEKPPRQLEIKLYVISVFTFRGKSTAAFIASN
jgi:hypothetical protein